MPQPPELINTLIKFRQALHQAPELSGKEKQTALKIEDFLKEYPASRILRFPNTESLAFIYDSGKAGPTILFRADVDALPVKELLDKPYISRKSGVSHKCGHDGHTAILSGLACSIYKNPPVKGKAILLFQAEEETGEGAKKIVHNSAFKNLQVDMAFALHNLPGFPSGNVVVKEQGFAAASTGMSIKLTGKPTHAAYPEDGINPAPAVSALLRFANKAPEMNSFEDFVLATVIHVQLGDKAFGTAASQAEVSFTLRAFNNKDLAHLIKSIQDIADKLSRKDGLGMEISFTEEFPATINSTECVQHIVKAAIDSELKIEHIEKGFRWSEDFGHFTSQFKSALFGLGSGKDQPQLHNEHYDFPDVIIEPGVNIFYHIYAQLLLD